MIEGNNDDDVIEQALSNLNKDEFEDSTTTQSQDTSAVQEPEVPEPEVGNVGHGGDLAGTNRYWEKKVRAYAKKFIGGETEYDPIEVDLTDIEWRVSGKMTRTSGRCKYNKPRHGMQQLVISKHLIDNADWERVQKTIRHELVHAWQKQNDESTGHGWSFKKWCDPLDISVRADNPAKQEYEYEIHCPECGMLGGKQRKCKSLKQILGDGAHRYCTNCGKHTMGDLKVIQDGVELEHKWQL